MITLHYKQIVFRDMVQTDIDDYVRWYTKEHEWKKWDAPWESYDTGEEIRKKKISQVISNFLSVIIYYENGAFLFI